MTDATLLDYWPTPERLDESVRAESDAVFLAVRPPVRLRRVTAEGPSEPLGEREFLAEFLRPDPPGGVALAAIEGGPRAAGFLRWLAIQLRLGGGADRRHVVTIAGGTLPQELVRECLVGLTGPEYDALRAELDAPPGPVTAAAPPSPDALAAVLRDQVAETRKRLEADPAPARAALDARRRKAPVDPATQAVLDDIDLIGWLGPGLAEWLTTPATNAAVLAALAEGRDVRESDFLLDSLPAGGAPPFRSVVKNFTATDENGGRDARTLAAQVLNRLLPAPGPDSPPPRSPGEILADLRTRLAADGRELIVTAATEEPLALLSTVGEDSVFRAAWCVSAPADTPAGAGRWVIDPELPVTEPEGFAAAVERVGEFLNATRLGASELARSPSTDPAHRPPTFDPADRLAPSDRATLEAFARSDGGRPLFPFSRALLRDIVHRTGGWEDAAGLIARVLVPILRENRVAFAAGAFPLPTYPEFSLPRPAVAEEPTEPAPVPDARAEGPTPVPAEPEPRRADPRLTRAVEWFGIGPSFDPEQVRSLMLDAAAAGFPSPDPDLGERIRDLPLAALAASATDSTGAAVDESLLGAAAEVMDGFDRYLSEAEEQLRRELPEVFDPTPAWVTREAQEPVRRAREAALASLAAVDAAVRGLAEGQP